MYPGPCIGGSRDLAENEEEEQRLENHLCKENRELAARDAEVAAEDGPEGAPLRPLFQRGCGERFERSVRPVKWMKTSSRLGVPTFMSVSVSPSSG